MNLHPGMNTLTVVVFSLFIFLYSLSSQAKPADPGDVNDDGVINALDIQLVRDHLLERSLLTGDELARADANEDGVVDLEDIAFIQDLMTSITIDVTPDEGSWKLEGPTGFTTITGTGDRYGVTAIMGAPVGDYTLTCDDTLTSYAAPTPQIKTLNANQSLVFKTYYWLERTIYLPGGVPLQMMYIPAGSFNMGRNPGEQDSINWEDPQHNVTIGYPFYLGKYELTKRQWFAVMGTTPWTGKEYIFDDVDSPAVYISWEDLAGAGGFIETLNAHLASTGDGTVRLPSESEWEYACRAGTTTRYYWGDDPTYSQIGDYAWYVTNAFSADEKYAHIVGLKLPNPLGLFDLGGNVYELCQDYWHDNYYLPGRPDNGAAWETPANPYRVVRGGDWSNPPEICRSAYRNGVTPDYVHHYVGARLVWNQPHGKIKIDVNPDAGSWTLTGPPEFTTITGVGDRKNDTIIINAPVGYYTLTCDDTLTSYTAPARL